MTAMLPGLVPTIYGETALDVAAFRQLGYVARKTAAEMAAEASRTLPRGRGGVLKRRAADEVLALADGLGTNDDAATALGALDAVTAAIEGHVRDAAETLTPAAALDPAAPAGAWTPPLLSSPTFLRHLAGLRALVDGMKRLGEDVPGFQPLDEAEAALWSERCADAEPDLLEFLAAAWAERLSTQLPGAMLKKAELEAVYAQRMTLRKAAGEAGSFPFAAVREGFHGLPVVVTGVDDEDNLTGFSTAAFCPDLHYAYNDDWRRLGAIPIKGADDRRWMPIAVDPEIVARAVEDFEALCAEPHVARYLSAVSPAQAAEAAGVSTVKMNTWLRERGLLAHKERKNTLSEEALKRGIGFVEETKYGPLLMFDAAFAEALTVCAEEMAATKRKALPPEPPTHRQVEHLRNLAERRGIAVPDECFATKKTCSAAIDAVKRGQTPDAPAAARKR